MGVRERLAQLLAAYGLSQAEVARRVGEHPTWVNNRVRGASEIKADDLPRLGRAIGVPVSAFFDDDEARPSDTPYADAVIDELSRDLPDAERELLEGLLALRRRYRQRLEEEAQGGSEKQVRIKGATNRSILVRDSLDRHPGGEG